jgi:hypothetical protein
MIQFSIVNVIIKKTNDIDKNIAENNVTKLIFILVLDKLFLFFSKKKYTYVLLETMQTKCFV